MTNSGSLSNYYNLAKWDKRKYLLVLFFVFFCLKCLSLTKVKQKKIILKKKHKVMEDEK